MKGLQVGGDARPPAFARIHKVHHAMKTAE